MDDANPDVQTTGLLTEGHKKSGVSIATDGQPVLSQPFLLDEEQFQLRPDLVKRVKSFVHSGKILSKDDELLEQLIELIALDKPLRAIARAYGVSRNTLANIRDEMETAGKLEPHKQRLLKKFSRLQLATADDLIDKAERGVLPANVGIITLGVVTDKKGQMEAGVVPGTDLREPDLDPEMIRQQWQRMKAAKVIDVTTVEKESTVPPAKPQ